MRAHICQKVTRGIRLLQFGLMKECPQNTQDCFKLNAEAMMCFRRTGRWRLSVEELLELGGESASPGPALWQVLAPPNIVALEG